MTTERSLPRINGKPDTETLATIFMGRHVERLSPLMSRYEFDTIKLDLSAWLAEWLAICEAEAAALDVDRLAAALHSTYRAMGRNDRLNTHPDCDHEPWYDGKPECEYDAATLADAYSRGAD